MNTFPRPLLPPVIINADATFSYVPEVNKFPDIPAAEAISLKRHKQLILLKILKPQLLQILCEFQIVDFQVRKYIKVFISVISFLMDSDILNKVIINGMTACSWRFNRLITLTVKVLNLDREIAKIIMAQFIDFEVVQ